jgi:hypothetical protein
MPVGVAQQLGHAGRPALARLLADRLQVAQQVRAHSAWTAW